jgi:two-component system, cell cycle sensor histidine kinase and response regulator CckA
MIGAEERINVLLVDDDEDDHLFTKDLLSRLEGVRHELHWVRDYQAALAAAAESDYDVCLVDYRLGPDSGIELVRELVASGQGMPVIMLTGQGDRDVDVEATHAGAADYLVKGEISPVLLERTIRYAIRRHADMQALRESEEGLRQAQRLDAIGQLAGGVAHDFNNMMTAVVGFSDLALGRIDDPDDPLHRYLGEIRHAGEHAAALAHQLLAFSRKQMLQTQVLDLNTVVSDVERLLQRLLADDVELSSVLDSALGSVKVDPSQLEQVIINLAINASDAMPTGGKLTIETSNIELDAAYSDGHLDVDPGPYVLLAVSDTGVGMSAETKRRVFEPFFTTKEVGKGTGLGLATVFGIVKQSGGEISVYSELGHGTTFKVYLPRVDAPSEDLQEPAKHPPTSPRGAETILLVDDEEVVRRFIAEVLADCGYTVIEARAPTQALDLAHDYPDVIHLLVTDVVMPGLSGHELAEQLLTERRELKTLYTSGYASNAIVRHGVLEPGIAFLPKPLNMLTLTNKVREVLDTPAQRTGHALN